MTGLQPLAIKPAGCNSKDPPDCHDTRGGTFHNAFSSTYNKTGIFNLPNEQVLGLDQDNVLFGYDTITFGLVDATSLKKQLIAGLETKDFYIAT